MTVVAVVGAEGAGELLSALAQRLEGDPSASGIALVHAIAPIGAADWPATNAAFALLVGDHGVGQAAAHDESLREALKRCALPYAVLYGDASQRIEAAVAALRPLLLVSRQGCSAGSSLALDTHGVVAPRRHSAGYDSSSRLALRADGGAMHRQNSLDATLGQAVEDIGRPWRPRCIECLDPACEQALHRKTY